ncbi:branched-chain amino acid ABC transporter permease [Bordetella sputigena]|uniref:branched-chain amino acid ABC transporter permease n=1 Tax=Bordetella sputigena TaxID=1416810 RepID=UPI0039EF3A7A
MKISAASVAAIAALLALALLPWITGDYYTGLGARIMIYAVFALSLQLLVGEAGLVSLGHAAPFGIGAYAAALLSPASAAGPLLPLLAAAVGGGALYAMATGALALRTRGVYFIMVTLAFAQMAYYVFHDTKLGGGSDGAYLYFRPEPRLGGWMLFDLADATVFHLFVAACLAAVWALLVRLRRSPFGAALAGIRINEQRMRAAGYSTFPYKLVAYTLGGGLAGLAGFLFALKDGFVTPELFAWEQSGAVLLMVILGGMARPGGAVAGAAALVLMQELFQSEAVFGDYARHWHLPMGIAVILLVALLPRGLAGLADGAAGGRARPRGDTPPQTEATGRSPTARSAAAALEPRGEPHA